MSKNVVINSVQITQCQSFVDSCIFRVVLVSCSKNLLGRVSMNQHEFLLQKTTGRNIPPKLMKLIKIFVFVLVPQSNNQMRTEMNKIFCVTARRSTKKPVYRFGVLFYWIIPMTDSIHRLAVFFAHFIHSHWPNPISLSLALIRSHRVQIDKTYIYKYIVLITPNVMFKFIQNVAFKRQRLRDWKSCDCVSVMVCVCFSCCFYALENGFYP